MEEVKEEEQRNERGRKEGRKEGKRGMGMWEERTCGRWELPISQTYLRPFSPNCN